MNPVKVFGVLAALLAAVAAVALLTRSPEPAATPMGAATPTVDHSLTNAESIARFKELKELRDRAYHHRDLSLIDMIYTSSSPRRETVASEIAVLSESDVLDRTRFKTLAVSVKSISSDEVIILQDVVVVPSFVSENGADVTTSGRKERQEVEWTLKHHDGVWLVHDTVILASRPAK